jgi:NitT/TauT family transport system substrate-binding protein
MRELRIGHLSTAYHTSLIIMGARWIEKKMNLRPIWRLFGGGPSIVEAFAKNELDIGYIGLPPLITGIDRGVPIKCVAGGHMEGTVFLAEEGFKSLGETGDMRKTLEQFRERTIGSPPEGSIHDVIIRNLLDKHGFSDIKIKNFKWADFIPEAIERKEIEAAVGTPSLAAAALHAAKIIIPPKRLWPNNPSYGIAASKTLIEDSPEDIEGFLGLHEDAESLIRKSPVEAGEIVSKTLGVVDGEFVQQVFVISPKYCASLSEEFIGSTLEFLPVLKELNYISRTLTEEDIFEKRFIEKIHPGAPHY